jgi:hypothetical protein
MRDLLPPYSGFKGEPHKQAKSKKSSLLVYSAYSLTLKMKAVDSSKLPVNFYWDPLHHNLEISIVLIQGCPISRGREFPHFLHALQLRFSDA